MPRLPEFQVVHGVDFSGAREAGRNLWVATLEPRGRWRKLTLIALHRLEALSGTAARADCLAHLVEMVRTSDSALWGFDVPFGLPLELFPAGATWDDQFAFLGEWGEEAYDCGLECVRRATELFKRKHIRRATDREAKAPFDAFHYRMIYQTFYGMRDVVGRLRGTPGTAVLPFQYRKLPRARRVLVECCPSSVLKRLGLPHQNYKQPAGGPLTRTRLRTRRTLLDAVGRLAAIPPRFRRVMMRNPGGDALDAVLAGVGAARAVAGADHAAIARHPRYPLEGYLFA